MSSQDRSTERFFANACRNLPAVTKLQYILVSHSHTMSRPGRQVDRTKNSESASGAGALAFPYLRLLRVTRTKGCMNERSDSLSRCCVLYNSDDWP